MDVFVPIVLTPCAIGEGVSFSIPSPPVMLAVVRYRNVADVVPFLMATSRQASDTDYSGQHKSETGNAQGLQGDCADATEAKGCHHLGHHKTHHHYSSTTTSFLLLAGFYNTCYNKNISIQYQIRSTTNALSIPADKDALRKPKKLYIANFY